MSQVEGRHEDDGEGMFGASPEAGRSAGPAGSGGPGRAGGEGAAGEGARAGAAQGEAGAVRKQAPPDRLSGGRSPLFYAQHAGRYQRQQLIRDYQDAHNCRLIVMSGPIFDFSVMYFEELLFDASPQTDLHLMLASPGGDGEVAVRLVRAAQARCKRLTVIVPDRAKSAATLLCLGSHEILMGPTSDLGPVDPQFPFGDYDLVSAKDIIAAVERALNDVAQRPDTYALHSAMLSEVNALKVEQARSALDRTDDLVREALQSNPDRTRQEVDDLVKALHEPLIETPKDHAAILGPQYAKELGLPVRICDPASAQWRQIWQLWMHYFALGNAVIYENERASQVEIQDEEAG
jgi:ClpP class serine protease